MIYIAYNVKYILLCSGMTNAEVLHQVEHGYRMASPQGCPPALYDIMLECWHKVSYIFLSNSEINKLELHLYTYIIILVLRIPWRDPHSRHFNGSLRTSLPCQIPSIKTLLRIETENVNLNNLVSGCFSYFCIESFAISQWALLRLLLSDPFCPVVKLHHNFSIFNNLFVEIKV